jgi:hypothetical protein
MTSTASAGSAGKAAKLKQMLITDDIRQLIEATERGEACQLEEEEIAE